MYTSVSHNKYMNVLQQSGTSKIDVPMTYISFDEFYMYLSGKEFYMYPAIPYKGAVHQDLRYG